MESTDPLKEEPNSPAPTILAVGLSPHVAGAERIMLHLFRGLKDEFSWQLGFLRLDPEALLDSGWSGPAVGLRGILFGKADLIHTHLFLPGLVVRVRRLWDRRFRWIHTVHYHRHSPTRWARVKTWLDKRFIFPAVDRLVAVSPVVLESLGRFDSALLIYNGIHLSHPAPLCKVNSVSSHRRQPVLGTVAMLRCEKGVQDLLPVVNCLRKSHPDVLLRVAGDGPLRQKLLKMVKELGLKDNVQIEGYLEGLDEFYCSLDVYVQPSVTEAFGLAVLEALRMGVPTVASSVGFLPALLGGGAYGLLVDRAEDFVPKMAEAIQVVLGRSESFASRARAGAEHWEDLLSVDRMIAEYRALYRSLVLQHGGQPPMSSQETGRG